MAETSAQASSPELDVVVDRPRRLHGGWYATIAVVTLARALAIALLPLLLVEAPLLLVLMSPAAADLLIAAPLLEPWVYFVSAIGAAMIQTAIAYHFGRALGERALIWLQSRGAAAQRTTSRLLGWLERATPLVLLAMPGVTVSTLAGLSGVRARRFYILIGLGNVGWSIACFAGGSALEAQLEQLYSFVGHHMLELTAVAATLVGVQFLWSRWRRGRATEQALARERD